MTIKQGLARFLDPKVRVAAKNLYDEIRTLRNHRRGVRYVRRLKQSGPLRVHFGCGPVKKEGWLNADLWDGPWATPDICLDVSRPFPFETDSVAEIYSEHMFEHLDYPNAARLFLEECFRVLKAGGKLTIGVPDLQWILERYSDNVQPSPNGNEKFFVLGHPLEELNYFFHQQGEHKFIYSEAFLTALLTHFGFATVRRRAFDATLDTESRRDGTLYVVATKPATKPTAGNGLRRAA